MFDSSKRYKMGSIWAIAQGLITFAAPRTSVSLVKRMLGANFENADELEARDSYLRQTRAFGVGLAAAGIAGVVMEAVGGGDDAEDADGVEADEDGSGAPA